MGNRRHICFLAPAIWPVLAKDRGTVFVGGAEVQQSFIARGLRDAGFQVTIITDASGHPEEFELDGLRIVRLIRQGPEIPLLRNVHPRLTSVWKALARADADVYFRRCAGADTLVAALFAKRYGRRFVYSGASDPDFQGDQIRKKFPGRGGLRDQWMYQWGLKLADGIVAQHRGQVEACRRWYGREATEIPNCYALPTGSRASRDGMILWVSTLKSLKRPELFLDLARRYPYLRFCMVGGPALGKEATIFSQIEEAAKCLPNLEFVGFVPYSEVESYFDRARLFINTSEYEGFPNTFLQSWARGVPTLSFVDCGAREGGRSIGFICHNPDDMASTLARVSHDDELWRNESVRAKQYFEAHHSVLNTVSKYSQLFEQVLSAQGVA